MKIFNYIFVAAVIIIFANFAFGNKRSGGPARNKRINTNTAPAANANLSTDTTAAPVVLPTPINDTAPSVDTPSPTEGQLSFYDGFETGSVSSGWTNQAISDAAKKNQGFKAIEVVNDPVRAGNYALKITVRAEDAVYPGDVRVDKERAELMRLNSYRDRTGDYRFGNENAEGTEWWYSWSVFIPQEYQFTFKSGLYQIMGQWHDQPDPGKDPTGYSPPIAVHLLSDGSTQHGFRISHGLRNYDDIQQEFKTPIEKGKWIDMMFHMRWSQGSDGYLEVWKDGVQLKTTTGQSRATGRNMFNAVPNYLRLGLYRGFGQTQTNTFYYDEVRVATTREALGQ